MGNPKPVPLSESEIILEFPTNFDPSYKTRHVGVVNVNEEEKLIQISFRGTKDVKDWKVNVWASSASTCLNSQNIASHAGFQYLASLMYPEVVKAIKSRFPDLQELAQYEVILLGEFRTTVYIVSRTQSRSCNERTHRS